jgi:hypothetical protein
MSDVQVTPDAETGPGNGTKTAPAVSRGRRSGTPTATSASSADAPRLLIKPVQTETLIIPIVGTAPLIVSRFSEKAKKQMLDAQQGVKNAPQKRDPVSEFGASLYRAGVIDPDGETDTLIDGVLNPNLRWGLPAMAFKMATIGAGRFYGKQVKMTELRQFMFFEGVQVDGESSKMIVIDGEPEMREDYVRLAGVNHPADLRYRGCFYEWSAHLEVRYTVNLLDRQSLVSLIQAGGMGVGVGEWRPERNGEFGTYEVQDGDIQVIRPALVGA